MSQGGEGGRDSQGEIESAFATRTDGGGSSMKGLTEGPARTALFSLRNWTEAQAHPGAAQASAQAQMQSITAALPSGTDPAAAATTSGRGASLQILGDLATGTVVVHGFQWTEPVDEATRQVLVSQLHPLATQMSQLGGQFAIVLDGPAPKGGKTAWGQRSAAFPTGLGQLGVVVGERVMLKPPNHVDATETRVEISR